MVKSSTSAKSIVTRLKDRDRKNKKINVTYRLAESTIREFKVACESQEVGPGSVLEELMNDFIQQTQRGRK